MPSEINIKSICDNSNILILLGFVAVCFLYGIGSWINKFFAAAKPKPNVIKILKFDCNFFSIILYILACLFIPTFARESLYKKFVHVVDGNSIDKIFAIIFFSEIVFLFVILYIIKFTSASKLKFNLNKINLFDGIKIVFKAYCMILPILVITTLIGQWILTFLIKLGINVKIDVQPIVEIISKFNLSTQTIAMMFLSVAVVAPICEEILFRGIVLRYFMSKMKLGLALLLSSILFGLVHMHFASLLPLCALGLCFGSIYSKTGNIYVCMFLHGLFNCINYFIIIFIKM